MTLATNLNMTLAWLDPDRIASNCKGCKDHKDKCSHKTSKRCSVCERCILKDESWQNGMYGLMHYRCRDNATARPVHMATRPCMGGMPGDSSQIKLV